MSNRVFVGVDVGGTKTAIASVRLPEALVLERVDLPTPPGEATGYAFLEEIAVRARSIADGIGTTTIGLSICELVGADGKVESAHRLQWHALPIADAFPGRVVIVESDVRAGAVAEARFGAGKGFREFLYINLGTGVSSCWVREGRPHRGSRGHALALASSPIETICEHCGKASSNVIEELAGAAGLVSSYRAAGGAASSARDVFQSAAKGDQRAASVIKRAGKSLAVGIGFAINILDPEAVVIGGGLAQAGGGYGAPLDAQIRAHVWSPATRALPILRANLGADSALIGAACFAQDFIAEVTKSSRSEDRVGETAVESGLADTAGGRRDYSEKGFGPHVGREGP